MQKITPEYSYRYREIRQKTKMISLSHDVTDHVYSKSKSIQLCADLANIQIRPILTAS